jgi:hypothetical protein
VKETDIEAILKLTKDSLAHLKIWSTAGLLHYCEVSVAEQEECQRMW